MIVNSNYHKPANSNLLGESDDFTNFYPESVIRSDYDSFLQRTYGNSLAVCGDASVISITFITLCLTPANQTCTCKSDIER